MGDQVGLIAYLNFSCRQPARYVVLVAGGVALVCNGGGVAQQSTCVVPAVGGDFWGLNAAATERALCDAVQAVVAVLKFVAAGGSGAVDLGDAVYCVVLVAVNAGGVSDFCGSAHGVVLVAELRSGRVMLATWLRSV